VRGQEVVSIVMRRAVLSCLVVALAALSCGRDEDGILSGEKLYSQFREELIIRHFFQDRREGFFVDVGCGPPIENSTTYYLEKHLGWSGIAIDAYADYAPAWEKERPRSRFFSYLVTDHSDTLDPFYRSELEGLSSTRQDRMFQIPGGPTIELKGEEVRMPTITLDKLLDDNGVTEIDFLSMDIEESEPQALAGFDIERFKPELVCIEAALSTRDRILAYMESHGYERLDRYREHEIANWYFAPKKQ